MIHMEYYLIVSAIMFFALFSIAISAAETAVAIAIMINIYRNIRSIQVGKLDEMKW